MIKWPIPAELSMFIFCDKIATSNILNSRLIDLLFKRAIKAVIMEGYRVWFHGPSNRTMSEAAAGPLAAVCRSSTCRS